MFCGIGFWEYERRELFWNPKVIAANQFESYFRVNSVFWDPNVYGRFLVLVILAVTALMLWSTRARVALASAVVLAVLWAGLVLTFSQSSFAALLAGLAVLAALRWDVRRAAAAAAAALVLGGGFAVLFQDTLKIDLGSSGGLNNVTSGRADLIGGGVELFAKRPLQGYGSGSFGRAYRLERKGNQQQAVSASHTMPVTVAAEQGLIGLAAYVAVLAAALWTLFGDAAWRAARGRAPPAHDGAGAGRRCRVPGGARGAGGDVRGTPGAHDGLRRVPRGPVHVGDPGCRRVARAVRAARPRGQAGDRPARATGSRLADPCSSTCDGSRRPVPRTPPRA